MAQPVPSWKEHPASSPSLGLARECAGIGRRLSARGATCVRHCACLVVVTGMIGASVAWVRGEASGPLPVWSANRSLDRLPGNATHIAATNLRVVATLVAGALLFGAPTALILAFNAFRLGWDLSALAIVSPGDAALMLLYVPLEYAGLVHGAAAGVQLGVRCFGV
ncbi:MAG: stage II sporulation protein M, partial [Vicinamibacteraceae bacterium]